jgi:hypothetical protein
MHAFLNHSSREVRTEALNWHARRYEDHGVLKSAADLLFDPETRPSDNYRVISALEIYCKGNDHTLALHAATILAEFVLLNVDYPGNDMTNLIWRGVRSLKAAQSPEEHEVVKAVFNSEVKDWRRGVALERLSELEGMEIAELLKASLSDKTLCQYAARGIAKVANGSDDASLTEALLGALRVEARKSVSRELVNALIAVGGNALLRLEGMMDELGSDEVMPVYWLVNDITPQKATELLVQAGVISSPQRDTMHQVEEKWQEKQDPRSIITLLLAANNRLAWFDRESSRVPPDYLGLLDYLSSISHDVFSAESFSHTFDRDSGESQIEFVYEDRAYEIVTRDFGGWFDVESLFQGLNATLVSAGKKERFVMLYTGDQTCAVVFAPGASFRQACRELRLPLLVDAPNGV